VFAAVGVAGLFDRGAVDAAELFLAAKVAWGEEGHEAPEFAEVVFHGGAGHAQAVAGREGAGDVGPFGVRVLDILGFVEDEEVEGLTLEDFLIARQEGIAGDDEVEAGGAFEMLLAVAAVGDVDAQPRGEALGFGAPVGHEAGGRDDEAGEVGAAGFLFEDEMGENLDGFAQAHVVGEDAAEGVFAKELEPGEAVELIGAEGGV